MKRVVLLILLASFLLGCQQQQVNELGPSPSVDAEETEIQTLNIPEDEFRFVAGWFDDQTIAFVVHQEDEDQLQTFNIVTGATETLYTDTAIISEAFIHPSKQEFLVKTADESTEANIIIFDREANVLDELIVESSELEIQWNPIDPAKLLLSAFAEDWSFEAFLYDANEQMVSEVALVDPFAQWFGEEDIVYIEDTALMKESLQTNEKVVLAPDVNQFHASSTQLLLEIFEDDQTLYKILDLAGKEKSSWVAEDPSQLTVNVEMVDDDNIIMSTTNQTEATPPTFFIHLQDGKEFKHYEVDTPATLLSCGSVNRCLTGPRLETLIQLETGETIDWLISE